MSLFKNILVGVDLHHGDRAVSKQIGPETRAAIEQAIELAQSSGGSLTFCSALEISPQTARLIEEDHLNLLKTVEDIAAEMLDAEVEAAIERGVSARRLIRVGQAWEEISKVACEEKCDLILIGTRSRDLASVILFGSNAQKMIRYAPCPVWVVKPQEVREIREIAVATDLSDSCIPVLHAGVAVARALNARLFVVHSLELDQLPYLKIAGLADEAISGVQQKLHDEATAKLHSHLNLTDHRTLQQGVRIEVLSGSPDRAISTFIEKSEVDLLVLGTHGRRGLAGVLLGNTAERMLPVVHASVLVVKPDDFVSPYATK